MANKFFNSLLGGSGGVPAYSRMLIIGNSFTIMPVPGNTIWWGTWGMAASTQATDFAHVLATSMAANSPDLVLDPQSAISWEQNHNNSFDYTYFDTMLGNDPDLIIIRLGENVTVSTNYQANFESLINYCQAACPTARIIVTDNYWVSAVYDAAQQAAAQAQGVEFVSLAGLDITANRSFIGASVQGDDLNSHTVNDAAVALHARDTGMAAIASRLYDYIYPDPFPGPAVSDADAQAFIEAALITDTTQRNALNQLVIDLKAASLWTKMQAVYPMVGGSALTHKWNLKDPRDLDAAYRLRFGGTLTHSANGVLPDGVTGFANTYLAPSAMTDGSAHWSYYSRTDILETKSVMGAQLAGVGPWVVLRTAVFGGSDILADYVSGAADRLNGAEADSLGLHTFSATGGNGGAFKAYKRGVQLGTDKTQAGNFNAVTTNFYLMATNGSGVVTLPTTRECAFATFGTGLNGTEAAALETAVTTYQTSLGRNV